MTSGTDCDFDTREPQEMPRDLLTKMHGPWRQEDRKGLSSDCTLPPEIALALLMGGREHPCDRCNMDRKVCRGFPRKDGQLR